MIAAFFKGDFASARNAYWFIKLRLKYRSRKIK